MSNDNAIKVCKTKNYRMFNRDKENRFLDVKKHKKLKLSMKRYGFLEAFPIVCYRDKDKKMVVKDGQHRLAFAEELGLDVYYLITNDDFNISIINDTPSLWKPIDHARKYAANGNSVYQEGIEFADKHNIPVGKAFALLAGTTTYNNILKPFTEGNFKIKDREWADMVASVYLTLIKMSPMINANCRLLEACMSACRVEEFDPDRLLSGAARCRDKLVNYSTREAYMEMLEFVYNFGRKQLFPLKIKSQEAMKARISVFEKKQ